MQGIRYCTRIRVTMVLARYPYQKKRNSEAPSLSRSCPATPCILSCEHERNSLILLCQLIFASLGRVLAKLPFQVDIASLGRVFAQLPL